MRLQIFHVDLSGGGFVAVDDRCGAFRHLYALHPRSGNIFHAVIRGQTANAGCVFAQHLYVVARQAEHFYLFGAGGGVAVSHIDRGVGFETFRQIAAGGFAEFGAGDFLGLHRRDARRYGAGRPCCDGNIVQPGA